MDEIEQAVAKLHLSSTNTAEASSAATFLANESRANPAVRNQLADAQALKSLTNIAECGLSDSLPTTTVALRCIGNACIDNDFARDTLASLGFSWALQCLRQGDGELRSLTVKMLYNICFEYEPTQQACFRGHIHYQLIYILHPDSDPQKLDTQAHDFAVSLLYQICSHKLELERNGEKDAMPWDVLANLTGLPISEPVRSDVDMIASLVETNLLYLRDPEFQEQIVSHQFFDSVWAQFQVVESRVQAVLRKVQPFDNVDDEERDDDVKILLALSSSLTWVLSDIAASRLFSAIYDLENSSIKTFISALQGASESDFSDTDQVTQDGRERSRNALYQIIGNLFWSLAPESYANLVVPAQTQNDLAQDVTLQPLHSSVIRALSLASSAELLHSGTGLLIQLSRPGIGARQIIGADENATLAMEKLCRHERPEIRQDAIKLLKALGKDCAANQERFSSLAEEVMKSLSRAT